MTILFFKLNDFLLNFLLNRVLRDDDSLRRQQLAVRGVVVDIFEDATLLPTPLRAAFALFVLFFGSVTLSSSGCGVALEASCNDRQRHEARHDEEKPNAFWNIAAQMMETASSRLVNGLIELKRIERNEANQQV